MTGVRLKTNDHMPFISYINNAYIESVDIHNGIIEAQVCNAGTLQKPLLTRWWHINTPVMQFFRYFDTYK